MAQHLYLNLSDIQQLPMGDFLKQYPTEELEPIQNQLCQNSLCQTQTQTQTNNYHIYEIDSEKHVVICNQCYNEGYRFCLFTHEVLHITQLDPVLEDMYAQASYHHGQLAPEILCHINNLYDYFKQIGIENPDPLHTIGNPLTEINHLE